MLVGGIQVAGTFFTTLIIEKFGRKVLLIISDFFICVSMLGGAVFFKMYEDCAECKFEAATNSSLDAFNSSAATGFVSKATVDSFGWLPLVSLMVFILAFAIGFGPIPWVLNVELMPPEARVTS
jgi:SP family facilitated glucose transporter-like MFS transporter 8